MLAFYSELGSSGIMSPQIFWEVPAVLPAAGPGWTARGRGWPPRGRIIALGGKNCEFLKLLYIDG